MQALKAEDAAAEAARTAELARLQEDIARAEATFAARQTEMEEEQRRVAQALAAEKASGQALEERMRQAREERDRLERELATAQQASGGGGEMGGQPSSTSPSLFGSVADACACSICMDIIVYSMTLSCSHSFCEECIEDWRANHSDCPTCRGHITSVVHSLQLDDIVEQLASSLSPQDATAWRQRRDRWLDLRKERREWDVA